MCPILDDEDAERVAGPKQRHAEEGVVDLLAGLGPVREGRVRLGVGERQRLGRLGDEADEALAGLHGGEMDGFAVEAFRGVELERPVGAHDVDRAHLGDHVGGDQDHHPVEARLRADRLRHDLAEAAQQDARSARSGWHERVVPFRAGRAGKMPRCRSRDLPVK